MQLIELVDQLVKFLDLRRRKAFASNQLEHERSRSSVIELVDQGLEARTRYAIARYARPKDVGLSPGAVVERRMPWDRWQRGMLAAGDLVPTPR